MLLPYLVEYEYNRRPVATISLIAANVFAFVLMQSMSEELLIGMLLWPDRFAPWQWVSACFLHADVFHLIGNMLFLWVFGRYVEERLGEWRYVALYFALGVAASLAYLLTQVVTGSGMPALGASGAVAGLMGVVLASGAAAKIRTLLIWFPVVRLIELPAWALLGLWLLKDIFYATIGVPGVAYSAHIGGFLAGVLVAIMLRQPRMRSSSWYLEPAGGDIQSLKERREARTWAAVADYHRRGETDTSRPSHPKPANQGVDPYEQQVLNNWNRR